MGITNMHPQPKQRMQRVDTLDLKDKLTKALGPVAASYWQSFRDFCNSRLSRAEFEEHASKLLKPEHVHLHNSLLLGLLYNASPGVPGPSSSLSAKNVRKAAASGLDEEDKENSRKRARLLVAGLSKKERSRLKILGRNAKPGMAASGADKSNLDWAGAGADLLEKKRKDDERRRSIEEKKRHREAHSTVGAKTWKSENDKKREAVDLLQGRLAPGVQQALARGVSTPLCTKSKELPTVEALRDRMTLRAVENGLTGGVHVKAAAMLLTALQAHIQNIALEAISKVRSDPDASTLSFDADMDLLPSHSPAPPDVDRADSPEPRLAQATGSPMRSLVPEMSFRTSVYGSSLGDTSMVSMISTAPTSFAPGSTTSSATGGMDIDRATVSDAGAAGAGESTQRTGLSLADLAFHLEMTPNTIVEPLGLGTTERLLAPDLDEEEVERETKTAAELAFIKASRETATCKLPAVSGSDATAEILASEHVTTRARSRFVIDQSAPIRVLDRRTLAETQALEMAKQGGTSKDAADRPTVGGLTISSSSQTAANAAAIAVAAAKSEAEKRNNETEGNANGKRKEARLPNTWEVVDPIALLADI